jgi:hypothetical protein
MGPIGRIELAIAPQAEKALHVSHREVISDLRTDTESARPEALQDRVLAGIVSDLPIGISGNADKKLFGEEVRRAPVEVEIGGWM